MRGFHLPLICILFLVSCLSGCDNSSTPPVVFAEDISPNTPNGQTQYWASSAGLTSSLAGDEAALYAVSLNAGVFKSLGGGTWTQLASSPRYTTALAVDPLNASHIVAGERNGDATPVLLNRTGVWESNDAGATWTFVFSPAQEAGCRMAVTQAVPAVFFSPTTGTLFIGTPCGVGRRPVGKADFDFTPSPAAAGAVKAFEVSHTGVGATMVWARADSASDGRTRILWSTNDGISWTVVLVPPIQDGYGIGPANRGGDFAIAAYGQTAVLDFRPDRRSDPKKWDPQSSNSCTLLYYFQDADQFKVQFLRLTGDGTGLGGRKRLRTFVSNNQRDNGLPISGQKLQIFYSAAQQILQATGLDQDGLLIWTSLAIARYRGGTTTDNVHADVWDVHYAASSGVIRLSTDGGIYRRQGDNWTAQNDGLHTHHVHSLSVLPTRAYPRVAYVVTDNSEWYRDARPLAPPFDDWFTYADLGDGSWSAADAIGPPVALLVRHSTLSIFTDFGLGMPLGSGIGANSSFTPFCAPDDSGTRCRDFTSLGTGTFAVIQTPLTQKPAPLLDVVMLVPTPLFSLQNGKVIPITAGPLSGTTSVTGGPILIRNRQYLAHPDVNQSQFQDWELVANDVPAGARAVWVANGHVNPAYYVQTVDGDGTVSIFRKNGQNGWFKLQGIGATLLNPGTVYGPLYVNPYDAEHIFVLAADGVRIPTLARGSEIGAFTPFEIDTALTALLSNSGEYPMNLAFRGGNGKNVVAVSQAGAFPKAILAQMGFNPYNTQAVVAASPVTGLYYQAKKYGGWQTLTPFLPTPYTMTSTVGMDKQTIYVGLEGRGVWRFLLYDNAQLGCYYDRSQSTAPDEVARLSSASTLPIGGVQVSVIVVRNGIETATSVMTGLLGQIIVPNSVGSVVHLSYPGDDNVGPCETSLIR